MTTDRDVARIVGSWLEEGRTALPDRVLDAVLDQIPTTPQRRAAWPARRFQTVSPALRLAGAIAAAVVVAALGSVLVFRPGGVGTLPSSAVPPSAAPSLSPVTPTPSLTAPLLGDQTGAEVAPGTYLIDRPFPARATITVPAGWTVYTVDDRTVGILVNHARPPQGSGWGLFFLAGPHFYVDPCRRSKGTVAGSAVATASDVVALLTGLGPWDATTSSTTVGERPATLVSLTGHANTSICDDGGATLWQTHDGTDYVIAPGQTVKLTVVDVDGVPITILATDFPESSKWENEHSSASPNAATHLADQVELRAMLASVRIESAAGPSSSAVLDPASAAPSGSPSGS